MLRIHKLHKRKVRLVYVKHVITFLDYFCTSHSITTHHNIHTTPKKCFVINFYNNHYKVIPTNNYRDMRITIYFCKCLRLQNQFPQIFYLKVDLVICKIIGVNLSQDVIKLSKTININS